MRDERDLLQRVQALDESAVGVVFDMYYDGLYRYIYHHVGHAETAEDLAAEVFSRLVQQIGRGQGPDRHLRAWLYQVAHNLIVDDSRREIHRQHDPLDEQLHAASQNVPAEAQRRLMQQETHAALDYLTPKQRAVIVLKFLEGFDNREIARVLNISVGGVKKLQRRALDQMRTHLVDLRSMVEEML